MENETTLTSASSACPRCVWLDQEITALRCEFEQLQQDNEQLPQDNEQLPQDNEQLRQDKEQLEKSLKAAQRSGKRQAAPFSRGKKKGNPKKPGRKKGHPGAKRKKPDRVDRRLEAPSLESCPDCGSPLEDKQPEENYETDVPEPSEPVVTRFDFARWWCPRCEKWVYSRHPEQTSTATQAAACHLGPRVRALAADLKCRLGLPFRKIQELLKDLYKIEVTAGALVHSNHRLAQRVKPTEDAMKQALAEEHIVGADETGWRVNGESHWLWVVCSERFTIYEIASHRIATVVRDILGEEFEGFLLRDGWSSYDAQLSYQMVRCLRHLQRNAEDLEDELVQEPAAETVALFVLWIDGVFDLKKQHRRPEISVEQYQEQAQEMIDWLDEFIAQQKDSSTPSTPSFAARLEKIRPQIEPILEHPEIPATNNHSERQIRPAVVHRKISAGNKTAKGAETLGRLASLTVSCRQNLVKFTDVVQRILLADTPDQPVLFWATTAQAEPQ